MKKPSGLQRMNKKRRLERWRYRCTLDGTFAFRKHINKIVRNHPEMTRTQVLTKLLDGFNRQPKL